jgi:hypothetical protein
MSVIPARKIERNRNPDGRNLACAAPTNHTRNCEEVCGFGTGGGT